MTRTEATWGVLALLSEIALLVGAFLLGHALLDGVPGTLLGIGLVLVCVLIWWRWMAPRSPHRLRENERVALGCGLFTAVAIPLAALVQVYGPPMWLFGCLVTVIAQRKLSAVPVHSPRDH